MERTRNEPSTEQVQLCVVGLSYLEIKEHSYRKYRILGKYLGVCQRFGDKYSNFVYVDTHGGSGKVLDICKDTLTDGSTLIAAKITPSFPCHVVEIDPEKYSLLEASTKELPNVFPYHKDCNIQIHEILRAIPKGQMFVFCFIDPDGLVYHGKDQSYDELNWNTVESIASFPRTELLLNLPLQALMECSGYIRSLPEDPASKKMEARMSTFFGNTKWQGLDPGDYKGFLKLYISERLKTHYEFLGAILVRNILRGPQYYLVYASKYQKGAEIMRDIMKKEHLDTLGSVPLTKIGYKTDKAWLDAEYPLTSPFIFED